MNPSYTVPAMPSHPQGGPHALSTRQYLTDLSTSLFSFVLPLLPTAEELATKEEVRVLIERLIKTIEPSSRLASFGSSCNSFGLRNSDMDLVCLIDNKEAALHASDLVAMIGDLLERETNFEVKPLPKARIPIIKLTLQPSPGLPYGIACDIGFENRLALENTRLLLTYATIDPARIRTLVLFLKVWSKRRKINSPYKGTLSSYGYTLMVIFYLVHVKNPPVLPNLQRIAPLRPMTKEEMTLEGRDVWFFDDTETLRKEWSSANFESVGELLIDFFRYFSHDFQYNNTVISIRAGHLTKESKGWMNDIDVGGLNENARDRNRLCIEDPFETPYNVARTVTKDGLYTIRGEFMRATRILTARPERAVLALAELCIEREDELARAPRSSSPAPRSMSGPRGYGPSGWKSNNMTIGPFDRMSQTMNGMMPGGGGSGEMDDFGRRSYSAQGTARRGRRSDAGGDSGPYSAQDAWHSHQSTGYHGGEGFRGRDMGGRHHDMGGYGDEPPHPRAGSFSEGGMPVPFNNMAAGSASAPISPVKSSSGLHSEPRNYSGTWSTGPSPRQTPRGLPGVGGPRMGGSVGPGSSQGPGPGQGQGSRRPSESTGRRQQRGPSYGAEFGNGNGNAYGSSSNSGYAQPQPSQHPGKRAYSVGAGPFPPTVTPGNVSPSELAMINGSSSSAAFQPFNSPAATTNPLGNPTDPYLTSSNLRTPETDPLKALPTMSPFPAYHSTQPVSNEASAVGQGDKEDFRALDELTSRVGQVALGLDDDEPKTNEPRPRSNGGGVQKSNEPTSDEA